MRKVISYAPLTAAMLPILHGRSHEVTCAWKDLAAEVSGQVVTIRNAAGRKWKGRVNSVSAESVVLTAGRGTETVPRALVSEVRFSKTLGIKGRIIGTSAGAGAGMPVLVFAEKYQRNEGSTPRIRGPAIGIAAAAATVGYFIGRDHDVERVTIRVRGQ